MDLLAAMLSIVRLWREAQGREDQRAMRYYALAFHALIGPTDLKWSAEEWAL